VDFISMVVRDCLVLKEAEKIIFSLLPLSCPHATSSSVSASEYKPSSLYPCTRENICAAQNEKDCNETAKDLAQQWLTQDIETRIRAVAELIIHTLIKFNGYDARVRVCVLKVAEVLGISNYLLLEIEYKVSQLLICDGVENLLEASKALQEEDLRDPELNKELLEDEQEDNSFEKDHEKKKEKENKMRMFKIGTAAILGGTLIGLTGGLAAPAIGAGLSAVGGSLGLGALTAGFGGFLSTAGGVALLTTVFGATGAGLNGYKMSRRIGKQLKEFWFHQVTHQGNQDTLSLIIGVHGWLSDADEIPDMWDDVHNSEKHSTEFDCRYVLVWDRRIMTDLGQAFEKLAIDQAVGMAVTETLKHTTLAVLMAAVAWPTSLLKVSNLIDNSWSVALNRAKLCGEELAIMLLARKKTFGNRPVSLYGYSVGALAIFICLQELAKKKPKGGEMYGHYGIIENVYLIGGCIVRSNEAWQSVRDVVAGRLVNAYSPKDWILSFLFRGSGTIERIAGLSPVHVYGVENINISEDLGISFHYEYESPTVHLQIAKRLLVYPTTATHSSDTNLANDLYYFESPKESGNISESS